MRVLIVAGILVAASLGACRHTYQKSTIEKLQGHWHMHEPYHLTLDISGTTLFINKYSMVTNLRAYDLLDSADNSIALPTPCGCGGATLPLVKKFLVTHETLTYDEKVLTDCYAFSPMVFEKSDPTSCRWAHALDGIVEEVLAVNQLTAASGAIINWDSLSMTLPVSLVAVAYPAKPEQYGSEPRILATDVFLEAKDLHLLVSREKERYGAFAICLIIDKSIPDGFGQHVINELTSDEGFPIFQMVTVNNGQELAYQRLR